MLPGAECSTSIREEEATDAHHLVYKTHDAVNEAPLQNQDPFLKNQSSADFTWEGRESLNSFYDVKDFTSVFFSVWCQIMASIEQGGMAHDHIHQMNLELC